MKRTLPTRAAAKVQAKRLREELAAEGVLITHAQALEKIAHRHGFRDWNTMHAFIKNLDPEAWGIGGRVTGKYLSQPFAATILSAEQLRPGWFHLVLKLDDAIDVVSFEGFSNLRKQIHSVVGPSGQSRERTSDGTPHLVLDP
jgi:hypothetical protein